MTNEQPKTLQMADELDKTRDVQARAWEAAKELRRLHTANVELREALEKILKEPNNTMSDGKALEEIVRIARAAIAEAMGEQR
jgi:hypothetical protein